MNNKEKSLHMLLSESMCSLKKLYECLDMSEQKWEIKLPNKGLLLLENLCVSKLTKENFESFVQLIVEAIPIVEDRILENKSLEMTNSRISKELDSSNLEILELKNELETVRKSSKTTNSVSPEVNIELASKNKDLQKEIEQQYLSFSKEIILMRDNLSMKEEMLRSEEEYQETKVWKLVQASYRETEAILKRMGIIVVNQTGAFDSTIQLVTDTVPTETKELHDTVAQTFREGYRTIDKIIRPQEVVLYSYTNN